MSFANAIRAMAAAVERGDAQGVAACFTPDGLYHDLFYGTYRGSDIARLIDDYFYRDGRDFRWDMIDPVEVDGTGYARYVFSYTPKAAGQEGKRAIFEGVAYCRMRGDKILEYREVANVSMALVDMDFAPERVVELIRWQSTELRKRTETQRHL